MRDPERAKLERSPPDWATALRRLPASLASVRGRILVAFLGMSLLSGTLGFYAAVAITHVGDLVSRTYDESLMSINYARATAADFAKMRSAFARRTHATDPAIAAKLDAEIADLTVTLAEDLTIAVERSQSDRAVRTAGAVQAGVAAWDEMRRALLDAPEARAERWEALDQQARAVDGQIDLLVNYTAGDGFTFRQAARALVTRELRVNIVAAVLAVIGCALIAWLLNRRITGPLAAASAAAERIAGGRLDDRIPTGGRDELGSLLRSMATMRDNIRAMMEREVSQRQSAETLLADALQSSREGVVVVDCHGRIVLANAQALRFFDGLGAAVRTGTSLSEAAPDEFLRALARDGEVRLSDGRWLRVSRSATQEGGFVAVCSDISLLKEQEDRLTETNLRLDAALDNMSQGLCLYDADDRLMVVNRRYAQIYGLASGTVVPGMRAEAVLAASLAAGNHPGQNLSDLLRQEREAFEGPARLPCFQELGNGKVVAIERRETADGGFVATYEDVTERRRAEAQVAFLAHHDALTGLPNRVALNQQMAAAIAQAGRDAGFAVFALDLDDFRPVNDTLGHGVGDELLVAVAQRLSACVREIDCVARLGADEFIVVQRGIDRAEGAAVLARRIIEVVSAPYTLSNHEVSVGLTIGITLAPGDGTGCDKLLKNADVALDRAKSEARGSFRFFEPEMDARLQARRLMERDLRDALAREAFEVYYQPIYSLGTERICGFEALLRWNHPGRGFVSPAEFIPIAEELGLIVPLGEWVLRRACEEASRWPDGLKIAVNVSAVQFTSASLVTAVRETLRATGLPGRRLELEITESVLVANPGATTAILHSLRAMGVRVSMDDFGTGYSSLSYLRSFPFDKIKIDQAFVRDLGATDGTDFIVRAVIGLGASLGMTTTAEGVETEAQLARLRAEGCDEVQGYLFSRPVPITQVPAVIQRWNGAARAIA
ncbi:EAL domain-containing protein [Methylobacterium sp. NEAU 140]|uniref:EAL domain-containing protein n=1 Tax=Methylobacterium sp. NEAU 140 TaxID=3064945 RepID=UPI00273627A1|nr:EAL domain-containing protein [Methylobacterium sp. NEAU 140]MDP4025015.1 EAL domain-containing protein [Methylobacterium sp. NEAU 140]